MPLKTDSLILGAMFGCVEVSRGESVASHWSISWNICSNVILIGCEKGRRTLRTCSVSLALLKKEEWLLNLPLWAIGTLKEYM